MVKNIFKYFSLEVSSLITFTSLPKELISLIRCKKDQKLKKIADIPKYDVGRLDKWRMVIDKAYDVKFDDRLMMDVFSPQ